MDIAAVASQWARREIMSVKVPAGGADLFSGSDFREPAQMPVYFGIEREMATLFAEARVGQLMVSAACPSDFS